MNLEVILKLGLDTRFEPDGIDVRITEQNVHLIKIAYRDYIYYLFKSDLVRLARIFGNEPMPIQLDVNVKGE